MTYDQTAASAAHLNLQQLAYLREVHRSGTLTRAAQRLHLSQPALSQSLTEVERKLGSTLFERRGRRRVFTEAGLEVVRFAESVLGQAAELQDRLDAHRRGEAGRLRIGMIDAATLYLLPEALRRFRETHPGVELELLVEGSSTLLERLRAFDLDLAFVVGPLEGDLETVTLLHEALYVYAPAGDPGWPEIADWALYPAGSQTRQLIDDVLRDEGVRPRVALESSNPEVLRQMVTIGLAWAVLPAAVAEAPPHPLRRRQEQPLVERSLVAARRVAAAPDPRIEALLALAAESVPVAGLAVEAPQAP